MSQEPPLAEGEVRSNEIGNASLISNNEGERSAAVASIIGQSPDDTALTQTQFATLVSAYRVSRSRSPIDSKLILEIYQEDPKLAEALLLYREQDLESSVDQAYLQYITNTRRRHLGVLEQPTAREHAKRYAKSLLVGLDSELLPNADTDNLESLQQSLIYANRKRYGRDDVLPTSVYSFSDVSTYQLKNAMWMAEMAALAYHERDMVSEQLVQWGYTRDSFVWIDHEETDTQAFVIANDDRIVVSFRGTAGFKDFKTDVKIRRAREAGGGRVHRGFQMALDDVWPKVRMAVARLQGNRPLYLTGHSLGAAVAQLAAFRFERAGQSVTAVYAYGSPLVGNRKYANAYNQRLGERTFLHINNWDAVTRIPPWWLGFRHAAETTIRKFVGRNHQIIVLDDPESLLEGDRAPVGVLDENGELLDVPWLSDEIGDRVGAAARAIEQSTEFLRVAPNQIPEVAYGTTFDSGPADDHGIHQYLFKLGCANLDVIWDEEKRLAGLRLE